MRRNARIGDRSDRTFQNRIGSSVAAGVRRIEAITAEEADRNVMETKEVLSEIRSLLKNPKDVVLATKTLLEEKHALEKKVEAFHQAQANLLKDQLASRVVRTNGHSVIVEKITLPDSESLKNVAYGLRNQFDDLVLVLAADIDGKPQVAS